MRIARHPLFWILAWSVWISAEYWIFGEHSYMRVHDNAESNVAFRSATINLIREYGSACWLPYFAGGVDVRMVNTSGPLRFDYALLWLLPPWLAYAAVMLLQRGVATGFAYLLARRCFGIPPAAAALSAAIWSLASWSTNDWTLYDGLGPSAIPLYLYLLDVALRARGMRRYALAAATGLLVSYCAYFPLFTPFFIAGSLLWLWIVARHPLGALVRVYVVFGSFTLPLAFPQLVGVWVNLPLTERAQRGAQALPFAEAAMVALGGVWSYARDYAASWAFVLGAAIALRSNALARHALLAAILVLGSRGLWSLSVSSRDLLPALASLNFNDFMLLATFTPALAIGHALCALQRGGRLSPRVMSALAVAGLLLCAGESLSLKIQVIQRIASDRYAANFRNPQLESLVREHGGEPFRVASVGVSNSSAYTASGENFYANYAAAYGLESADGYLSLASQRYHEYWGAVLAPLRALDSTVDERWRAKPIWLYLFAPSDGSFSSADAIDVWSFYDRELLSLANTRYLISPRPLSGRGLTLHAAPEAGREVWDAFTASSAKEKLRALVAGDLPHRPLYVYANEAALPRAFLTSSLRGFATSAELVAALASAELEELRTIAFIEGNAERALKRLGPGFSSGHVAIVERRPDRLVLASEADGPSMLIVTQNYSPDWHATVDGEPRPILAVDRAFQGVALASGAHRIVLEYRPRGVGLSWLGCRPELKGG